MNIFSNDKIDYKKIVDNNPWIVEEEHDCIISPDVDGILSGLLMTDFLNWNIVGYYNGKEMLIKKGYSYNDCVFLDMEILRKNIRSIGHHMNIHNFNSLPPNYFEIFKNVINPNNIRKFDRCHQFSRKYPLGNIHFLLYLLEFKYPSKVVLNDKGLAPLFFADGVWKILFKYTDNVLDWFDYLHTGPCVWWSRLKDTSVLKLIHTIDDLINDLKKINNGKSWYGHINLKKFDLDKKKITETLELFNDYIGWNYKTQKWELDDLKKIKFNKEKYEGSKRNEVFFEIMNKKPFSLAMTTGNRIEYTLEQ